MFAENQTWYGLGTAGTLAVRRQLRAAIRRCVLLRGWTFGVFYSIWLASANMRGSAMRANDQHKTPWMREASLASPSSLSERRDLSTE